MNKIRNHGRVNWRAVAFYLAIVGLVLGMASAAAASTDDEPTSDDSVIEQCYPESGQICESEKPTTTTTVPPTTTTTAPEVPVCPSGTTRDVAGNCHECIDEDTGLGWTYDSPDDGICVPPPTIPIATTTPDLGPPITRLAETGPSGVSILAAAALVLIGGGLLAAGISSRRP